ncbi:MAG TPA: SRPBCC domain-containing protein, partial [Thermoplasmata archaeon]
MIVKNLTQKVTFKASPSDVYKTLLDPDEHEAFSGEPAKLDARVGGRFEHFGGSLSGIVVHLEKDRRIVLAWRSSGWPEGHYSIAQFVLKKEGKSTRLEFSQFGIPS